MNIAGASAYFDGGASAVDDSADVMAVEAALHGDWLRDVDAAGAGFGVEVEAGIAYGETDGTAAGGELPVGGWLAGGFDVATAGAGFEGSGEALKLDAARAGFGFNVAWSSLVEDDIPRAGAEGGPALDTVGGYGAGAGLGLEGCADVLNVNVAGACGGVDIGSGGKSDVVVDADVAVEIVIVALAYGDVVSALDNWRVADDLLDAAVDVVSAAHPAVAGVKMSDDVDLAGGAGMQVDGSGAGGNRDIGRAAHV